MLPLCLKIKNSSITWVTSPFTIRGSHYPHHLFSWKDTEAPIEQINNDRDQFIVNLKLGLLALMQDRVSHHKHSNEQLTHEEIEEKFRARAARKAREAKGE